MTPAVAFQSLYKDYGPLRALDGIDLTIEPGSYYGLLGPNGAGKSTLIGILAGLVRATRGTARVMGFDVTRDYRRARSALGVVPQEIVYDPFFSVREILKLQAGYFGCGHSSTAWIDELLSVLQLEDKADTNIKALSGGMKRRVLIAQALIHRPQVLVLDEPTAGVDIELRRALWAFTQELHRQGHTIVLTTHYLDEAETLCDRIAIVDHGRLRAEDSKHGLLARHPYRILDVELEAPPGRLPESVQPHLVSVEDRQVRFRVHRVRDSIGALLEQLYAADLRVRDLRTEEPGLEEVFVNLLNATDNGE